VQRRACQAAPNQATSERLFNSSREEVDRDPSVPEDDRSQCFGTVPNGSGVSKHGSPRDSGGRKTEARTRSMSLRYGGNLLARKSMTEQGRTNGRDRLMATLKVGILIGLSLLAISGRVGAQQPPVNVTLVGTPTSPAAIPFTPTAQGTFTLQASDPNPPPTDTLPGEPPQPCTGSNSTWSWSAQIISGPAGPIASMNPENGPNTSQLTVNGFTQPGAYQVQVTATVSYDMTPCSGTVQRTGTCVVVLYVVSATFSPSPVIVPVNNSVDVTGTVVPPEASSYVTFATADPTIATVSGIAPDLNVAGVAAGTTQLQASLGGAVLAQASVTVVSVTFSPSPVYVTVGGTASLTATVQPPSAASLVSFTVDDSGIASVSGSAPSLTVNGLTEGDTFIQANVGSVACATVTVTVFQVSFNPDPVFVAVGSSAALTVLVVPDTVGGLLTFDTADDTIATVTGSAPSLTVVGVAPGTTQVRAWLGGVTIATVDVNVVSVTFAPSPLFVAQGSTASLTATVQPASALSQVTFDMEDTSIATYSGNAPSLTVNGVTAGHTVLYARLSGEVIASVDVYTVSVRITVNALPDDLKMDPGASILIAGGDPTLLAPVTVSLAPSSLPSGTLTLTATSGSNRIRLWTDTSMTTQVSLPASWNVGTDTLPTTLSLEGVLASDANKDVQLTLTYTNGAFTVSDQVNITVCNLGCNAGD
jgi:Bacterial Ig-like domain (group 2)